MNGALLVGGAAVLSVGGWFALKRYIAGPIYSATPNLSNKVAVVTGSNTGIGFETAKSLAKLGARVILACRNKSLGEKAVQEIKKELPNAQVEFMELDLSSFASIRHFAEEFKSKNLPLNLLVNNAGVWVNKRALTKDGLELQIGVNHFGHFYLTSLLLDILKKSTPSRIVNVSSRASERGKIFFDDLMLEHNYGPLVSYTQSKLANVLFTMELGKRLEGTGVTTYALHPGVIHTELARDMPAASFLLGLFPLKTPVHGAQTTLYCCLEPGIEQYSGKYFSDCGLYQNPNVLLTSEISKKFWELSESLVNARI